MMATTSTSITGSIEEDPYNPDWVKSQNPASNPDFTEAVSEATAVTTSESTTTTTTTTDDSVATSVSVSTSNANDSYPSHSEFYTPQPAQLSEAEEIAKKKQAEEKRAKGNGGAIGGAAAVAGIAGLCLVGPIVGVAAAGGAAYVAATNKGAAGSVFRASGKATSVVASGARQFDKKHQVTAKTARGVAGGVRGVAGGVGWIANKVRRNKPEQSS